MPSFTTFDKAIAAFIGSIVSMIALLGYTVPNFFSGPLFNTIMTVLLPSLLPTIMTYISKNKPSA